MRVPHTKCSFRDPVAGQWVGPGEERGTQLGNNGYYAVIGRHDGTTTFYYLLSTNGLELENWNNTDNNEKMRVSVRSHAYCLIYRSTPEVFTVE
jgi:hypothetical protein